MRAIAEVPLSWPQCLHATRGCLVRCIPFLVDCQLAVTSDAANTPVPATPDWQPAAEPHGSSGEFVGADCCVTGLA
jgi:hypothetical protein